MYFSFVNISGMCTGNKQSKYLAKNEFMSLFSIKLVHSFAKYFVASFLKFTWCLPVMFLIFLASAFHDSWRIPNSRKQKAFVYVYGVNQFSLMTFNSKTLFRIDFFL